MKMAILICLVPIFLISTVIIALLKNSFSTSSNTLSKTTAFYRTRTPDFPILNQDTDLDVNIYTVVIPPNSPQSSLLMLDPCISHSDFTEISPISNLNFFATAGSSSSKYFKIKNDFDYYLAVQFFLMENQDFDKDFCPNAGDLKNPFYLEKTFAVIRPGEESLIGPLVFAPDCYGEYYVKVLVKSNNKGAVRIRITGKASGAELKLSEEVFKVKNEIDVKIQNFGDLEETIQGVYFPGLTCSYHALVIKNCFSSFQIAPGEESVIKIQADYDQVEYFFTTEIWLQGKSQIYTQKIQIEVANSPPQWDLIGNCIFPCLSLLFLSNSFKRLQKSQKKKVISSKIPDQVTSIPILKPYRTPISNSDQLDYIKDQIRSQLSLTHELIITIGKKKNSEDFTLGSVTTDTRINSPVNSFQTEEDSEILENDLYLDMYKVSGIFASDVGDLRFR